MEFFDTHAHYDDARFDADREALVASLPGRGVTRVVDVGADIASSRAAVALAERFPFVWAAAGVHPHEASGWDADAEAALRALVRHPRVVALGEIGLDFHYDLSPRDTQVRVFRRQLEIAEELDVPVVIHSREASEPTLEMLAATRARGVVHCYSGSAETARALVAAGWYIGFTGAVTFKNARRPLEAAAAVPLDRLLLETDCPYMTPVPHRGERCDSTLLAYTAAKLAEIKGVDVETLAARTYENGNRLYRL